MSVPARWGPSLTYYVVITMLMTIFILKVMEMLDVVNVVLVILLSLGIGLGWVAVDGVGGHCGIVVMVATLVE